MYSARIQHTHMHTPPHEHKHKRAPVPVPTLAHAIMHAITHTLLCVCTHACTHILLALQTWSTAPAVSKKKMKLDSAGLFRDGRPDVAATTRKSVLHHSDPE